MFPKVQVCCRDTNCRSVLSPMTLSLNNIVFSVYNEFGTLLVLLAATERRMPQILFAPDWICAKIGSRYGNCCQA